MENVWCIVRSQFYGGDYYGSVHQRFVISIVLRLKFIITTLEERIQWIFTSTLFLFYFFADAMSHPQIGLQIGEIHNENTGGGNVQNSTASVPGSGYPLVIWCFSMNHFQTFSKKRRKAYSIFKMSTSFCTIWHFMHTLHDFVIFWLFVIRHNKYTISFTFFIVFFSNFGLPVTHTIQIIAMIQHQRRHQWMLNR